MWEASQVAPSRPLAVGLRELDRKQASTYLFAAADVWHAAPMGKALRSRCLRSTRAGGGYGGPNRDPHRVRGGATLPVPPRRRPRVPLASRRTASTSSTRRRAARDLSLLRTARGPGRSGDLQRLPPRPAAGARRGHRARAGARELHDGVIQSLIGLEMHLEVLRRQRGRPAGAAGRGARRTSRACCAERS